MVDQRKLRGWKRVLAFVGILCLLPLAPEIIIFLDVVGLEATLLFLFLYSQSAVQDLADRVSHAYFCIESAIHSKRDYRTSSAFAFSVSATASFATLFLTGSLAFAVCAWGPMLVSVSQIVA